jgi:hypothetical protein
MNVVITALVLFGESHHSQVRLANKSRATTSSFLILSAKVEMRCYSTLNSGK